MTTTHKAEAILHDCVFTAEFTYLPGRDACGPAYDHGGLPADPAEIELLELTDAYGKVIELNDAEIQEVVDWLLDTWEPPTGPDPDDERDRRIDDELTSRA